VRELHHTQCLCTRGHHTHGLNLFKDYQETHTDNSNHFIYTRFLVPHLMGFSGRAIFIDGDMIVRGDIVELFESFRLRTRRGRGQARLQNTPTEKYLGSKNEDYPRKNWSSVISVGLFYFYQPKAHT
jgi:hypothetical protein